MTETAEATLVLTVLNESSSIVGFLESLEKQSLLPREIVIVDGGSTDGTPELLRSWVAPAGCEVCVIVEPGANISEGRNIAIAAARFEKVLVTDAGTSIDPRWAERMLEAFTDDVDVVGGFFRPTGATFTERRIAFTITPHLSEIDGATFLPSSRSIAFRRSAWSEVGGYPEWLDYCEDLVFDLRMKHSGLTFAFAPHAIVTWSARPTYRQFIKQYFRYARGDGKAALWAKRHAARYTAYALGIALVVGSFAQPLLIVALVAGAVVYLQKFWRRLWNHRRDFGSSFALGMIFVPFVVVCGDLGKMAGYPVGLAWRRTHKP